MPKVECFENGPYSVTDLGDLRNSAGEVIPTGPAFRLCRCGGSNNKPFCDGTHRSNGFTGARENSAIQMASPSRYEGKEITILDNRSICAHKGHCTQHLASVWLYGQEPWINPNGGAKDKIIETVHDCPSGALAYEVNGSAQPHPARPPLITVSKNGPYELVGNITLVDEATGQTPNNTEHYTLCRCGGSKNKPFCDGTHWSRNFQDDRN